MDPINCPIFNFLKSISYISMIQITNKYDQQNCNKKTLITATINLIYFNFFLNNNFPLK